MAVFPQLLEEDFHRFNEELNSFLGKSEATLAFLPELRPMLAVGVIEGQINLNNLSARSILPGLVEWAVCELGAERLLFGSDTPLYSVAMQRTRIESADIPDADKRVILRDNRIVGAVLYGDTADGSWYFDLLKKTADVTAMRDTLVFGQAYQGGVPMDPAAAVAALSDDAEICGCNGVCKGVITRAIAAHGLTTLEDVRARTKASASCGQCTVKVEGLLAARLGDKYAAGARKPMCKCTDLTHAEVRDRILTQELKSLPAVMQELGWKTSCGCPSCRPALNYYLLCAWPFDYRDDAQSRFVNERVHANIQKDGTFSVVPRMWGGLTTPDELRAIADVADPFKIPTVKVTGGQRIDLLGVRKEDLPEIGRAHV